MCKCLRHFTGRARTDRSGPTDRILASLAGSRRTILRFQCLSLKLPQQPVPSTCHCCSCPLLLQGGRGSKPALESRNWGVGISAIGLTVAWIPAILSLTDRLLIATCVSLGQYYSTVRAIHSPRVYIKIIISSGCPSAEGCSTSPL